MENELDLLTKKYWGRFAIIALLNAAIFTTYRLYIHKLHKEEQNKNLKKEKDNNKHDKVNIPVKLAEELTNKPVTKRTQKASKSKASNKNAKKTTVRKSSEVKKEDSSPTSTDVTKSVEKRAVGRPRRPARVAPHIQKEKK